VIAAEFTVTGAVPVDVSVNVCVVAVQRHAAETQTPRGHPQLAACLRIYRYCSYTAQSD
jgi:hypothetical protein